MTGKMRDIDPATNFFTRDKYGGFSMVVPESDRIIVGCTLPVNGGLSIEIKEAEPQPYLMPIELPSKERAKQLGSILIDAIHSINSGHAQAMIDAIKIVDAYALGQLGEK